MYDKAIMKLTALLLLSALPAVAQTKAPVRTTPHHSEAGGCVKVPALSPKIPALPADAPCAKALYTITTVPSAKLDYVSPLEGPTFRETLGIEPSTFTLAYIDTRIGTGELAAPHKFYTIHYTGYLVDGTKFDSSVDRGEPITVPYGQHQVIPGWDTGFGGMHVGSKRRLFIPYQLAYGPNAHQQIPPKSELVFDVELVSVSDTPPAPKTGGKPPAKPGSRSISAGPQPRHPLPRRPPPHPQLLRSLKPLRFI